MQIEILAEGLDEVHQYLSDQHDPDVDLSLSSAMDAEDMAPGFWRAGLHLDIGDLENLTRLTYRDQVFRVERCSYDEYHWWAEGGDDGSDPDDYGDFTIEYVNARPAKLPAQPAPRRNQPRRRTRRQRSRRVHGNKH
jgi:hypothetical protein